MSRVRPLMLAASLLWLATALFGGAIALAQEVVISPRSIVINPLPAFNLQVWVDKDPSGRDAPVYRVGESITISVRPSVDAHVYLFSIAADGEVLQVLPNRFDNDSFVRANTTRTFPPSGARYGFSVAPPNGLAKVIAVASRRPLDTSTLARFRTEGDFATSNIGEDGFARALRIIVTPVPAADWVTATALYYVGERPSVGAFGTLRVDSEPRRAEVYLDRSFVGYTPLTYDLRPGNYDVEVVGAGRSASERVQIRPDRTTEVFLTLGPVVRQGTATFTSSPAGADVYVDGRYLGTTTTGRLAFDEGSYQAEFRRDGYLTERVRFEVRANADTRVSASLQPIVRQGTATFTSSPTGADVYVDGRYVGTSNTGRVTFDVGSYQAEFRRDGFQVERVRFEVRANADTRVSATLRALTGTLEIQANVGGARVFIDGREVGVIPSGTGRLTVRDLQEGTHEVVLVAPGYRTVVQEVRIRAGQTTNVTLRQNRL